MVLSACSLKQGWGPRGTPWSEEHLGQWKCLPDPREDGALTNVNENVIPFFSSFLLLAESTLIFHFIFFRSAQSTMGKAVDAFSKYFLCLKCKSCSGTTTAFAFPPFPGNFGLTIFQCFRFSRYVALRSSSLFSQCLCN